MEQGEERTQELIRIIGAERAAHPPKLVAAAERELIRRAGGTRKQALARVRVRGACVVTVGLLALAALILLVAVEGVPFLRGVGRAGEHSARVGYCLGLVMLAILGLACLPLGVALLISSKWTLRMARRLRLVGAADFALLTTEPPSEAILDALGRQRDVETAHNIAHAERELDARLLSAREATRNRIRRWGKTAIGFGLLLGLHGVAGTIFLSLMLSRDPGPYWAGEGLLGAPHFWMMLPLLTVNMGFGAVLIAGGLGLRKLKAWARKTIVAGIWTWFGCSVAMMTALGLASMILVGAAEEGWGAELILTLVWIPVGISFWVVVLRSITKPMCLPEVREACGEPVPSLAQECSPEVRRRRARRIYRWMVVVVLVAAAVTLGVTGWLAAKASRAALAQEALDAAWDGDVLHLQRLLQDRPELANVKTEGMTPLHGAASSGHIEAVRMLLSYGADAGAADEWGQAPLHMAAAGGHAEVAEFLLANGAPVNAADEQGYTPLHHASSGAVTEVLLKAGADLSARSNDGRTALHSATQSDHKDVAEPLLEHGADVNATDEHGRTPFHVAALYRSYGWPADGKEHVETRGRPGMAQFLLANGADVNAQDNAGRTALHHVAQKGWQDWVELLLAHGADPNIRDFQGFTPLDLARQEGHEEIVQLLRGP